VGKVVAMQPAAVGLQLGAQGQFFSLMQMQDASGANYWLHGVATLQNGASAGGRWDYAGAQVAFVGGAEIVDKYKWFGREDGDTVRSEGTGLCVIRYPDGSRYSGAYRTVGQNAALQLFRLGVGAYYDAKGNVISAGKFANDAYVGPE
jgi:hypothetical protein